MRLAEFIKQSISEVLRGLKDSETTDYKFGIHKDVGIEFDVAVVSKVKAGAKVGLEIFSIGAGTRTEMAEHKMNRLRFRVYAKGKRK